MMDAGTNERNITQSHSQETLRRVKENDETLTGLWIGGTVHIIDNQQGNEVMAVRIENGAFALKDHEAVFNPSDDKEFTSLNEYIAENTHLSKLVYVEGRVGLDVECLRRNSSIQNLGFACGGRDIDSGAIYDILQVYKEKGNLTTLGIDGANLLNDGGVDVLVNTLRSCTNLKTIILYECNITHEQLLEIVEAIRGHCVLKKVDLAMNSIENVGCEAIATLLDNPNCNIHTLSLVGNNIGNEGAVTIANSLANNTKLQKLILRNNPFDQSLVEESFCKVLCNVSSISSTHSSNHTLKSLVLPQDMNEDLLSLLELNKDKNKSRVTMIKILKYHPKIDMGPMFEWDEDGEQNLKALPYVISWFERAQEAVLAADENGEENYNIEKRKLDAINQFARTMPLLFEGVSTM